MAGCGAPDLHKLGSNVVANIQHGQYAAVILDAWYRFLPGGSGGENDNTAMADAFNRVDGFASKTGAAWFLIHHASKGSQSEKSVTDVGAGAGAQSRAADCHMVVRPHEEPGHVVLDAVVRSFRPIDPLVLRWDFPVFKVAHGMNPAALQNPKTVKQSRNDNVGQNTLLDLVRENADTVRGLTIRSRMSRDRVQRLLNQLVEAGSVESSLEDRRGNECQVYRSTAV